MNFKTAKLLGVLSKGVYEHAPGFYFKIYRSYKRVSDSYKHELLRRLVAPGSVVLDIGAYIGHYTLFLADLVGERGRVLAFEPDPNNFARLKANTASYQNIEIHEAAVGNRRADIHLYISADLNVDHRVYSTPGEQRKAIPIKQISLDGELLDTLEQIAFIKMDVEGYEFQALSGMRMILERKRPKLLMELWPWGLSQGGSSPQAVLDFLASLDYQVRLIDEQKKIIRTFSPDELGETKDEYYDVIAEPVSEENG